MTTEVLRAPRARLAALAAVAVLGTLDVAEFALTEPGVAFKTPGRASGTLFGLGVWAGLTLVAGSRLRLGDSPRLSNAALGLAGVAALDGVGLALIHIVAGVGGLRPVVGAVLGLAAAGLAVSARDRH